MQAQVDPALYDVTLAHAAFRPPRRVSVAEGAADALYIRQPGGYTGPWSSDETPYMVEPMNEMASKGVETVCFVGPARTGKTLGLLEGFLSYAITCDPGDTMVVQMSQEKAREYSKVRIDRMLRYSPQLNALKSLRTADDNTHDKMFKHGMYLRIGWPSVTQLSGSDYRYVLITDYDRMPDDIEGEGSAYGLALKRTQTFMSRGMCAVESSPGRELSDPNWIPSTPHEAPPVSGILGIYNRSDRRRWYWPCPHCGEFHEAKPGLSLFNLPDEDVLVEMIREADLDRLATEYAHIFCIHCGEKIESHHKHDMNLKGVWLAENQTISADGTISGDPPKSPIAGFWMGGVAAAYQSWHSLVLRYLQGVREYALSGSDLTLQNTINTDQGMPYLPRILAKAGGVSTGPEGRKEAGMERFIVPDEARFLVAAVDVQGGQSGRFVVQVHAVGKHMEQWLVDRYSIVSTDMRQGMDGDDAPIDPASYPEDWDMVTKMVVDSTYRLIDGREMRVRMVAVDTGGEDGVTDKAYAWFRRIRREGKHGRVMLVKGGSVKNAPMIKESLVGGKKQGEKGDVILYLLNTSILKDAVSASLRRAVFGPGYMHYGKWTPKAFFDELSAEVRDSNGTWRKVRKRNESLDLSCYIRAAIVKLGADRINWDRPPAWADDLSVNIDVISRDDRQKIQADTPNIGAVRRRTSKSSYLG